ncbi:hypothetical protein ABBQ38_007774 [Trebouxia sp. C0009 RCD-2024]
MIKCYRSVPANMQPLSAMTPRGRQAPRLQCLYSRCSAGLRRPRPGNGILPCHRRLDLPLIQPPRVLQWLDRHPALTFCTAAQNISKRHKQGSTQLHQAASKNRVKQVRTLLATGADLSVKDKKGRTALHHAAMNGHGPVIRSLLAHGDDVHATDYEGSTPLHLAVIRGHIRAAEMLLKAGADAALETHQGYTSLGCCVVWSQMQLLDSLLFNGVHPDMCNTKGDTALHYAALTGKADCAWRLIQHQADVDAVNGQGQTPLHCSVRNGHEDVTRLLLRACAEPDSTDAQGLTCLHTCIILGRQEQMELLLFHLADVDVKNGKGQTALEYAVMRGKPDSVRLLLEHGANINMVMENEEAFSEAMSHTHILDLLLSHGADPNHNVFNLTKDDDMWPNLHMAVFFNLVDAAKVLLRHGAKVDVEDVAGLTPLWNACAFGQLDMARVLLSYGADVSFSLHKLTPLHIASDTLAAEQVKAMFRKLEAQEQIPFTACDNRADMLKLLLWHAADVSATTDTGRTPLHIAACSNNTEGVKVLLSRGAKVDAQDCWGATPLHLAAADDALDVARHLIAHGANIAAKNAEEQSPLHAAAGWDLATFMSVDVESCDRNQTLGKEEMETVNDARKFLNTGTDTLELLISCGADVNCKSIVGETPLHHAALSFRPQHVRALLAHGANVHAPAHLTLTKLMNPAIALVEDGAEDALSQVSGWTPLHLTELVQAFKRKTPENAIRSYDQDAGLTDVKFEFEEGRCEVVRLLLEQGASIPADSSKVDAIDLAASMWEAELLGFLHRPDSKHDESVT